MKIIRYKTGNSIEYGILEGEQIQVLVGTPFPEIKKGSQRRKASEVKLLAPCEPSKVVAIGLNYYSHAKEVGQPVPKEPIMFYKPSTSVIGPEDKIVNPGCTRLDYEAELGVVIKSKASKVSKQDRSGPGPRARTPFPLPAPGLRPSLTRAMSPLKRT
jgi:2-keto-4-pentenoate hydratase/2-oxohepta-3-ene-1,7-dioic acid hydratase in catechol pathway